MDEKSNGTNAENSLPSLAKIHFGRWLAGAMVMGALYIPILFCSAVGGILIMIGATSPLWYITAFLIIALRKRHIPNRDDANAHIGATVLSALFMPVLMFIGNYAFVETMTWLGLRDWIDIGGHIASQSRSDLMPKFC